MSKKIFHSTPKNFHGSIQPRIMVDPGERRKAKPTREFIDDEVVHRGADRRKARQDVKRNARYNRETTRDERRRAKLPVTSIDFQVGDLVYHTKNENTFMLVTGINQFARHVFVECMIGTQVVEYKALHLRKADD